MLPHRASAWLKACGFSTALLLTAWALPARENTRDRSVTAVNQDTFCLLQDALRIKRSDSQRTEDHVGTAPSVVRGSHTVETDSLQGYFLELALAPGPAPPAESSLNAVGTHRLESSANADLSGINPLVEIPAADYNKTSEFVMYPLSDEAAADVLAKTQKIQTAMGKGITYEVNHQDFPGGIDCTLSDWSEWSDCGPINHSGFRNWFSVRARVVTTPSLWPGTACPSGPAQLSACKERGLIFNLIHS